MKLMKATLSALALLAWTGSAAVAATYSDLASFDADVDITLTEDFEALGLFTNSFDGPYLSASGITVSSQSNELFSVGPGQSTNPTTAIGSNFPDVDTLTLMLGGVYKAFAAEFYQNNGGGIQDIGFADFTVVTYLAGIAQETFDFLVGPNGGSFFGFTTLSAFDEVEVVAVSGSLFEVVDTVQLGDSGQISPVPLPAGFPLLAAGLFGLGLLRRARV